MLVVADTSPLIVLCNIEQIDILPALFQRVVVPPQVLDELRQTNRTKAVLDFMTRPPAWLNVRSPSAIETIPAPDAGELAAISLAMEVRAELLLIDETRGRKAARDRRIRITGTIGVLELAADERLVNLRDAFARIKKTDFWISHDLLDERLRRHEERRTR